MEENKVNQAILDYIERLETRDWSTFSSLSVENMTDAAFKAHQAEWETLQQEMRAFLSGLPQLSDFSSFQKVRDVFNEHLTRISHLPYKSVLHIYHPFGFYQNIIGFTKELEFIEENKNNVHPCGCALRLKHFLGPDTDLEKIGQGDDGYYDFDVYECTACHFKWVCITIDNPTMSEYSWAKWEEEEYPMYKSK